MDVNKDPPLQAVTHASTTTTQWETEKETGNGQKPKCLWGTQRWSSTDGGEQVVMGSQQVVEGLNKCVYSLEVDSASFVTDLFLNGKTGGVNCSTAPSAS